MPVPLSKRDPTVAAVLRRWRALTGGSRTIDESRRTLVACSGGPDSVALALALHASGRLAGLVHIVHDLRPPADARADRDFVADLAGRLQTPFLWREIAVRDSPGSAESSARTLRYRALDELSKAAVCPFVATAHHADDQLETLIMRLARGSGPRGLRGILPRRRLAHTVVVRPCLEVRRDELSALCERVGVVPRTDATNADTAFARNAIRATVLPELARLFPGLARRAGELTDRMRSVERAIEHHAVALLARATLGAPGTLSRDALRGEESAVLHAALRRVVLENGLGADGMTWRAGEAVAKAVRDHEGGVRRFAWGPADLVVSSELVSISRRSPRPA